MLSPVAFHILIALGDGPKHGYAVMRDVSDRSEGGVDLLPGTLYSTLKRLLSQGLVEPRDPPPGESSSDERRRYYRVTARGRALASAETDRLATLVRLARKKGFASAR